MRRPARNAPCTICLQNGAKFLLFIKMIKKSESPGRLITTCELFLNIFREQNLPKCLKCVFCPVFAENFVSGFLPIFNFGEQSIQLLTRDPGISASGSRNGKFVSLFLCI